MEKYNGWTNYPTWNVALWMDNHPGSHQLYIEMAEDCDTVAEFAQRLENQIKEGHMVATGMYADIMGWALSLVNWIEIAEHYEEHIGGEDEER